MRTRNSGLAWLQVPWAKACTATLLWTGCIVTAMAAADAPAKRFAAPAATGAVPAPAAGLAQVTLSLVLVLAAVFAAAWLLRRLRAVGGRTETGSITVIAERAVGPRERVVLLQVGNDRVLVGVAAGNVRALHAMRDVTPAAPMETAR